MSADYAVPSTTALERDAHEASSDHTVAPGEIAIGVVIGRAAEYFDFFVYGIASVLIFPGVFFPFADPLTGTLYAFALFALAFIARPIGSVIFMEIDRRHGRAAKLTIALFLLGFLGLAISLFPYIVPPHYTIWQAANAVSALQFALVGYSVVMPLTLAYTGYAYWVFRGKVVEDIQSGGYGH